MKNHLFADVNQGKGEGAGCLAQVQEAFRRLPGVCRPAHQARPGSSWKPLSLANKKYAIYGGPIDWLFVGFRAFFFRAFSGFFDFCQAFQAFHDTAY